MKDIKVSIGVDVDAVSGWLGVIALDPAIRTTAERMDHGAPMYSEGFWSSNRHCNGSA